MQSEYCHNTWCGETRVVWLAESEKKLKICSFVSTEYTNGTDGRTDGRTDTAQRHRPRLCIASRGNKSAVVRLLIDDISRPSHTLPIHHHRSTVRKSAIHQMNSLEISPRVITPLENIWKLTHSPDPI